MADVFISYSRQDRAFAQRLHQALEAQGRDAYMDVEDIPAASRWRQEIAEAIEGAEALVFVVSPDSAASEGCREELAHAAALHKRVIPLVCRETEPQAVPEALRELNWISCREQDDFEAAIATLIETLDTDLDWVKAHTRLLTRAGEWERQIGDMSLLLRGSDLGAAESWLAKSGNKEPKPTDLQGAYILASRQAATRRKNISIGVAFTMALVLAAIAVYAVWERNTAVRQAKVALSRQLAAQALTLLDNQIDRALLLSVEACRVERTAEARRALLESFRRQPYLDTILRPQPTNRHILALAFSPDGKILASGDTNNSILLWDVQTRRILRESLKSDTNVEGLAFLPDGITLISVSGDIIKWWDTQTSKPIGPPLKIPGKVYCAEAFSPDGKTLATANENSEVILWDLETRQPQGPFLKGHTAKVLAMAFNPDNKLLATGSDDKTIILWELATGKPSGKPLTGHKKGIYQVAFNPDGKILATGSYDHTVILWNLETRPPLGETLEGYLDWSLGGGGLAFSADGKFLAMNGLRSTITLWDVNLRRKIENDLRGPPGAVRRLTFSPDSKLLASGHRGGTITLWDLEPRDKPIACLQGHGEGLTSVAFSSDGKILASAGQDQTVILRDAESRKMLGAPLVGHQGAIKCLAFSPDGKMLATGSNDRTVRLWNIAESRPVNPPLVGHESTVTSVAFSPDGRTLASGGQDGAISFWNLYPNKTFHSFWKHHDEVVSLNFSPKGKVLGFTSSTTTNLIRLADKEEFWHGTSLVFGRTKRILVFSPNGNEFAETSGDTILVNNFKNSKASPRRFPDIQRKIITSVAFSSDGKILASGNESGEVILWDLESSLPITPILAGKHGEVTSLAFSPDDKLLAGGAIDGSVVLWDVSFDGWMNKACQRANRNLTRAEWRQYLGDEPYRPTCPGLPVPED